MAKQERVVADNYERIDPIVPMFNYEILTITGIGAGVGLLVTGAAYVLDRYVFRTVVCGGDACSEATTYAMTVAMVIGALLGLVALVQARVYRPLLVALAATIGLWGVYELTQAFGLAWYWTLLVMTVLFAVAYALFSWVARIRAFVVAIVATLVFVVAMRLILSM